MACAMPILALLALAAAAGSDPAPSGFAAGSPWPGRRGPRRDGIAPWLPATPRPIWRRLEGPALAGIAATESHVIVADRDAGDAEDIFRCLRAERGEEIWSIRYAAPGDLGFGNAPRATPLIADGRVYLLGAFGDLRCVDLASGAVAWKRNLPAAFGARAPKWGYSASPLAVDDKRIVNPVGRDASLVALDRRSGAVLWRSPGAEGAYASFIVGTFGGVLQIVGYDKVSLGGWEIESGKRLWTLVPPASGDYNVPTPIDAGGELLLIDARSARFSCLSRLRVLADGADAYAHPALVGPRLYLRGAEAIVCLSLEE